MHIGVDLDNTLICYDDAFRTAAIELLGAGAELAASKTAVKKHVLSHWDNDAWTRLQAEVYGPRISLARPFAGVNEFFRNCAAEGHTVSILSHKTRRAALGSDCDLHRAALGWIASQGWCEPSQNALSPDRVHFFSTRLEKIHAVRDLGCDLFIDDLVEVLTDFAYPAEVPGILFGGDPVAPLPPHVRRRATWEEISEIVFSEAAT